MEVVAAAGGGGAVARLGLGPYITAVRAEGKDTAVTWGTWRVEAAGESVVSRCGQGGAQTQKGGCREAQR